MFYSRHNKRYSNNHKKLMSETPEQIEIFPLTSTKDTNEEAALKVANALRQFGVTDRADELEACAQQDEKDRDECISDILSEALTVAGEECPSSLELHFFEEGKSGFFEVESDFDGYAFVSRKESLERWQAVQPSDALKDEALREINEVQRRRHDPDA
jgi:hypothetical protein